MNQEQHTYRYLQELKGSDYQIVNGEPNIIGWEVKSESHAYLGKIKNLLFDPQTNAVRYLIIDLTDNGMHLNDKKVMVPIGIAHLHLSNDEVVLPNIHIEQFNALPSYVSGQIGPEAEVEVRNIIGSPAALRIEESVIEFDQNQFYTHQHFNHAQFYQRGGSANTPERTEEKAHIHQLISNSLANDLHAADEQTGAGTHHNEQRHEPEKGQPEDPSFPKPNV